MDLECVRAAVPPPLRALAALFKEAGVTLYAVGGMVRNPLMGLDISDIDVTSAMTLEAVSALCARADIHCVIKGREFGTAELHFTHDGARISVEHTTFRRDTYAAGGTHRPMRVIFGTSLEQDAFRRDFTVNALYYDILGDTLTDPTGGLRDLKEGLLRATSPDPGVILGDDALRIMRLARFCAELGFEAEPGTLAAAKRYAPGLGAISGERVRDELDKLLLSDVRYLGLPCAGPYHGLKLLDECGALDIILPELTRGRGIAQREDYHRYDVLGHCLHTVPEIEASLPLRLAALLHDVGKPAAYFEHGNMRGHDALGAQIAREILHRLKYPCAVTQKVVTLTAAHMYDLDGNAKDSTLRVWLAGLGRENAADIIKLRIADVHGSGVNHGRVREAENWRRILDEMLKDGTPFSPAELDCSGEDIMCWRALPPGKEVGEIKQKLFLHCVRRPADNTRERLMRLARGIS